MSVRLKSVRKADLYAVSPSVCSGGESQIGMPTQIVTPCWIEKVIQEEGAKQADLQWGTRSQVLDDLPRGQVLFVRVGTGEVEVELIGGRLGEKVGAAGERFQIKELVLDEAMNGFHVALVGVSGGRDADMLAFAEGRWESGGLTEIIMTADKLTTIVGLPDQVAKRDTTTAEMLLDAFSENGASGGAAPLGKGQEEQAAANLACGVLDHR